MAFNIDKDELRKKLRNLYDLGDIAWSYFIRNIIAAVLILFISFATIIVSTQTLLRRGIQADVIADQLMNTFLVIGLSVIYITLLIVFPVGYRFIKKAYNYYRDFRDLVKTAELADSAAFSIVRIDYEFSRDEYLLYRIPSDLPKKYLYTYIAGAIASTISIYLIAISIKSFVINLNINTMRSIDVVDVFIRSLAWNPWTIPVFIISFIIGLLFLYYYVKFFELLWSGYGVHEASYMMYIVIINYIINMLSIFIQALNNVDTLLSLVTLLLLYIIAKKLQKLPQRLSPLIERAVEYTQEST